MVTGTKARRPSRAVAITTLLFVLLTANTALADVIAVDTFNSGLQYLQTDSSNPTAAEALDVPGGDVLGDERDVEVNHVAGPGFARILVDFSNSNRFSFNLDSGVTGRVRLTWDGDDNHPTQTNPLGLNGQDMSAGDTNDGLLVLTVDFDHDTRMTFSAYSDADLWSDMSVTLLGDGGATRMDVFYPYASFVSRGSSGGVDWGSVGALVLDIDGTLQDDLDLSIDAILADSVRDYGDLPEAVYGTAALSASHIPQGMRLGHNCDAETTFVETLGATGDDSSQADDEDGVTPSSLPWQPGEEGGEVELDLRGCSITNRCYVHGWIDWNNDGDFVDDDVGGASEHIVNYSRASEALVARSFDLPDPLSAGFYYARFRICGGTSTNCDSPTDEDTDVLNGEIEDYRWYFSPTAVRISSFAAVPANGTILVEWETASEVDNLGFNLFRRAAGTQSYIQLNRGLIPSQGPGTGQGYHYSFLDRDVQAGLTYQYLLEDVNFSGMRTPHGPVQATFYAVFLPLVLR